MKNNDEKISYLDLFFCPKQNLYTYLEIYKQYSPNEKAFTNLILYFIANVIAVSKESQLLVYQSGLFGEIASSINLSQDPIEDIDVKIFFLSQLSVSSIYEKVGVSGRIALLNVYYDKTDAVTVDVAAMQAEKASVLRVSPIPKERLESMSLKYGLTRRETELLEQVCLRKTNEDIAAALGISENTVKFHLKNLMKKLSVSSRTEIREMLDSQ